MISEWERREDYWTNISSPDFDRDLKYRGYLETRKLVSSDLRGLKKNSMWQLRKDTPELLRQGRQAYTGFVLWGCPDIPGGGGSTCSVQEVRDSEAGATAVACEQPFLHEAVLLLRGAEMSCHDRQGRSKRAEAGLAYGQGIGQGVHGETASAQPCGSTPDTRDRRTISAERAYLSDRGKRFGAGPTDLVRRS